MTQPGRKSRLQVCSAPAFGPTAGQDHVRLGRAHEYIYPDDQRVWLIGSSLCYRKKFWLLPIIACLLLLGTLIVFTSGSAVAPFIYTLF